jgi:hypothetical protein
MQGLIEAESAFSWADQDGVCLKLGVIYDLAEISVSRVTLQAVSSKWSASERIRQYILLAPKTRPQP